VARHNRRRGGVGHLSLPGAGLKKPGVGLSQRLPGAACKGDHLTGAESLGAGENQNGDYQSGGCQGALKESWGHRI
jgi:hypothetical protein